MRYSLFQNVIIPRLRSWVRKVVSEDDNDVEKETDKKPSLAEEAAAAAKSAAAAAADVAKASQEMLNSKTEGEILILHLNLFLSSLSLFLTGLICFHFHFGLYT